MSPDEMKAIAIRKFGEHDWKRRLAEALGAHVSTVRRWARGGVAIPAPVAIAVKSLEPYNQAPGTT